MSETTITIVRSIAAFAVAIICLTLSRQRYFSNVKFAHKYANNLKMIWGRYILTIILKAGSIVLLIGVSSKLIDDFVAFYILAPFLIALTTVFFYSGRMKAIMTIIKGGYYIGLGILSAAQYIGHFEDNYELALGFTLALAIFESVSAISEGILVLEAK